MSYCASIIHRYVRFSLKALWQARWLMVLGLLFSRALASSPVGPWAPPSDGLHHSPLFPASVVSRSTSPQAETPVGRAAATSSPGLEAMRAAIGPVHTPRLPALAAALGLSSSQTGRQAFDDSTLGMETLSGLEGGEPAAVVKWRASHDAQPEGEPDLYLLSWDGKAWQASYLVTAAHALTLQVLPVTGGTVPLFAVIFFRGIAAVPYPVIFRFREHQASRVWDGRSDTSLYAGYNYGSIQFEKAGSGDVPVMIATGQADPGLLVFPTSPEQGGRGFQAATVYAWQNDAYVPLRTEYTRNRDYILYRFIADLHLHNFKAAYALIDPQRFLKTDKPTLQLFSERVQDLWPEFLDDRIFEVPAEPEKGSGSHPFILRLRDDKMNVYHPTFTGGPDERLAGLERTESAQ